MADMVDAIKAALALSTEFWADTKCRHCDKRLNVVSTVMLGDVHCRHCGKYTRVSIPPGLRNLMKDSG